MKFKSSFSEPRGIPVTENCCSKSTNISASIPTGPHHKIAQRFDKSLLVPVRSNFHSHRIDSCQKESRSKPAEHKQRKGATIDCKRIGTRTQDRTLEKYLAGRYPIGHAQKSKQQRTTDKTELYGRSDVTNRHLGELQLLHQIRNHGIARKPE